MARFFRGVLEGPGSVVAVAVAVLAVCEGILLWPVEVLGDWEFFGCWRVAAQPLLATLEFSMEVVVFTSKVLYSAWKRRNQKKFYIGETGIGCQDYFHRVQIKCRSRSVGC